jgi:NAD(P)-dependent dehydrogenase (short-subunit alcohol dehydrogenase family)
MKGCNMVVGGLPQQRKRYHAAYNQSSHAVINFVNKLQEYWQENETVLAVCILYMVQMFG